MLVHLLGPLKELRIELFSNILVFLFHIVKFLLVEINLLAHPVGLILERVNDPQDFGGLRVVLIDL